VDAGIEVGGTTESVTVSADGSASRYEFGVYRPRDHAPRGDGLGGVWGNNVSMCTRFSPGVQVPGTTQFLVQGNRGGGSGYSAQAVVGGNGVVELTARRRNGSKPADLTLNEPSFPERDLDESDEFQNRVVVNFSAPDFGHAYRGTQFFRMSTQVGRATNDRDMARR
jgi:hypothetical protein